jgi:hypothetical protein
MQINKGTFLPSALVQGVGIRHGSVAAVVIIPDQIEPTCNLESGAESSAKERVGVVRSSVKASRGQPAKMKGKVSIAPTFQF